MARFVNASQKAPPVPSGEVLLEEFLKPLGISQYQLTALLPAAPEDGATAHGNDASCRLIPARSWRARASPGAIATSCSAKGSARFHWRRCT